jgi:Helix-turn-helix domain
METDLLTTGEVAQLLRRHPRTLRNWRDEGVGPLAIPVGHLWAYRRADVDAYLDGLVAQARERQSARSEKKRQTSGRGNT